MNGGKESTQSNKLLVKVSALIFKPFSILTKLILQLMIIIPFIIIYYRVQYETHLYLTMLQCIID